MKYFELSCLDVNAVNELIHKAVEIVVDNLSKGLYEKSSNGTYERHGITNS